MKSVLLLPILFILVTTNVDAQEVKDPVSLKRNYTGIAFRGSWGRSIGFEGDIELRYGRFLTPHWLVGAAADFRQSERFNQQSFGAFARYYFKKQQKGLFLETSYKVGLVEQTIVDRFSSRVFDVTSGSMNHTFIGAGYAMVNKKNLGVEFFAGWESTKYNLSEVPATSFVDLDQGLTTGIRFQFQFK